MGDDTEPAQRCAIPRAPPDLESFDIPDELAYRDITQELQGPAWRPTVCLPCPTISHVHVSICCVHVSSVPKAYNKWLERQKGLS